MSLDFRIISIGTLAAHPLWNERGEVRTGHATTTLISAGDAQVLVNPSLPAVALGARLGERTSVKPDAITHVFLTSFQPDHRRALPALEHAIWLAFEPELQAAGEAIRRQRDEARDLGDDELVAIAQHELALLERCHAAEDSLTQGVDLFPLPGVTAGTCGLLINDPRQTILIAGDAVATREHFAEGQILPGCVDVEQAHESFKEAIEIADIIVPGRDNLIVNPVRRVM